MTGHAAIKPAGIANIMPIQKILEKMDGAAIPPMWKSTQFIASSITPIDIISATHTIRNASIRLRFWSRIIGQTAREMPIMKASITAKVIVRVTPSCRVTPIISPNTSPIAQPVRQCKVAAAEVLQVGGE